MFGMKNGDVILDDSSFSIFIRNGIYKILNITIIADIVLKSHGQSNLAKLNRSIVFHLTIPLNNHFLQLIIQQLQPLKEKKLILKIHHAIIRIINFVKNSPIENQVYVLIFYLKTP